MALKLRKLQVGPWPMNTYLISDSSTGETAIVDPGADAALILETVDPDKVCCILLTHGHPDHIGALEDVLQATGAPVGIHFDDAQLFGQDADFPLLDGMEVQVGNQVLAITHVPGHTPGSVCLVLDGEAIVGDAIFPGGPGHTPTPEALGQSLMSLGTKVFVWPDEMVLHPGHGGPTTVGAERAAFEAFVAADHEPGICGDISWR
jgi:glyoxylase-like metal-dependent hydrolase (beta-lactamase superfamily II)